MRHNRLARPTAQYRHNLRCIQRRADHKASHWPGAYDSHASDSTVSLVPVYPELSFIPRPALCFFSAHFLSFIPATLASAAPASESANLLCPSIRKTGTVKGARIPTLIEAEVHPVVCRCPSTRGLAQPCSWPVDVHAAGAAKRVRGHQRQLFFHFHQQDSSYSYTTIISQNHPVHRCSEISSLEATSQTGLSLALKRESNDPTITLTGYVLSALHTEPAKASWRPNLYQGIFVDNRQPPTGRESSLRRAESYNGRRWSWFRCFSWLC